VIIGESKFIVSKQPAKLMTLGKSDKEPGDPLTAFLAPADNFLLTFSAEET